MRVESADTDRQGAVRCCAWRLSNPESPLRVRSRPPNERSEDLRCGDGVGCPSPHRKYPRGQTWGCRCGRRVATGFQEAMRRGWMRTFRWFLRTRRWCFEPSGPAAPGGAGARGVALQPPTPRAGSSATRWAIRQQTSSGRSPGTGGDHATCRATRRSPAVTSAGARPSGQRVPARAFGGPVRGRRLGWCALLSLAARPLESTVRTRSISRGLLVAADRSRTSLRVTSVPLLRRYARRREHVNDSNRQCCRRRLHHRGEIKQLMRTSA